MQDLPFQTLTQFVALGLTLIAGWFLGLASSSGGRKWRERYYDADVDNAGYRDRAEADLREAARRIRELESENATLRAGVPVAAAAPVVVEREPVVVEREPEPVKEGHSTAALAGAALAGAAVGAAAAHVAHEHQEEPVAADHAEPAHTDAHH